MISDNEAMIFGFLFAIMIVSLTLLILLTLGGSLQTGDETNKCYVPNVGYGNDFVVERGEGNIKTLYGDDLPIKDIEHLRGKG